MPTPYLDAVRRHLALREDAGCVLLSFDCDGDTFDALRGELGLPDDGKPLSIDGVTVYHAEKHKDFLYTYH